MSRWPLDEFNLAAVAVAEQTDTLSVNSSDNTDYLTASVPIGHTITVIVIVKHLYKLFC